MTHDGRPMKDFLLSAADRTPAFRNGATAIDLTGDEADVFFDALASETSRAIFDALYEEPSTPSELTDEFDTSLQNVHYHLKKLQGANLIESVDTVYSSRGREVQIYAPTHEATVLVTGEDSTVTEIKSLISRLVGILAILAVASVLVQVLLAGGSLPGAPVGAPGDSMAPGGAGNLTATPDRGEFAPPPKPDEGGPDRSTDEATNSSGVLLDTTDNDSRIDRTATRKRTATDASTSTSKPTSTDVPTSSPSSTPTPTATSTPTFTPTPTSPSATMNGGSTSSVAPGVLFFVGGLWAIFGSVGYRALRSE